MAELSSEEGPTFSSMQDILDYYNDYLSGKLEGCPTHDGPLEQETMRILPDLLRLNRLGILSVDSQPGLKEQFPGGELYQRAYLDCYMPLEIYSKLETALMGTNFCFYGQKYSSPEDDKSPTALVIVSYALERDSETHGMKTVILTEMPIGWISPDMDIILENTPEDIKVQILDDLYSVRIMDPVWGNEGALFKKLVEILSGDVKGDLISPSVAPSPSPYSSQLNDTQHWC